MISFGKYIIWSSKLQFCYVIYNNKIQKYIKNIAYIIYTFISEFIMIRTEKRLNANRHSLTADVKRGQGMRSLFYGKNLTGGTNNESSHSNRFF